MSVEWKSDLNLNESLGTAKLYTDEESIEKFSKDFYWYSPVLGKKLKDKRGDVIIAPQNEEEVKQAMALAYRLQVPVTVRGAGTGNYGQAVPLQGGIVLDMSGLNQIVELGDGYARVQSGVRMGVLERTAREAGQELRIYPSTFAKATIGGFVCGGSGGIGSVTWGNLWDGNVLEVTAYTMEEHPQKLVVKGEDLINYIHNYGTTGVVTEVVIPLAQKTDWVQVVFQFADFMGAVEFGEALSEDMSIPKRLVSPMEWPLPSFFKPLAKVLEPDAAVVFVEIADGSLDKTAELAKRYGGKTGHVIEAARYRKTMGLSDFTWNHTTLWALTADPAWTYLQAGFAPGRYLEQVKILKEKFGDEVLMHFEWIRNGGVLSPNALPVVRFTTEARLYEIIDEFLANGVEIYDPHTWMLDNGGRGAVSSMRLKKQVNDPLGLLNPGKIG
ncbi:FAD-binding oxidoreductase [Paenibacillus caui]|uniref:FAD-binding oxidoreductase n=1 Tax=Paenibacillus caui TaxID=2873927 RepID=UPI001CA9043F|nr:FAD-binding oxidoreductase [Paenibacillus caui]